MDILLLLLFMVGSSNACLNTTGSMCHPHKAKESMCVRVTAYKSGLWFCKDDPSHNEIKLIDKMGDYAIMPLAKDP